MPCKPAVMRVDTNLRDSGWTSTKKKNIIRKVVWAQENMLGKAVTSSCLNFFKTGPDKAVTVSDHPASTRRLEYMTYRVFSPTVFL